MDIHEESRDLLDKFRRFWKRRKYSVYCLLVLTITYLLNQTNTFSLVATNVSMANEIGYGDRKCIAVNSSTVEEYSHKNNQSLSSEDYCTVNEEECLNQNQSLCKWVYKGTGLEYQLLAGPLYIVMFSISGIALGLISELHQINRKVILVICVLLWGLMTILGGFATRYWHIAVARFLLGIFSAGCVPFSASIIADLFPASARGAAIGFFNWGIYVGYSFTFLLLIAERTVGWRAVYYIAGVPSVVIGFLILFTVRDPPRGGEDNKNEKPGVLASLNSTFLKLRTAFHHFAHPALLLLCIGGALRNGAGIVWAYNIVNFFNEYHPGTDTEDWMTWIPLIFGSIGAFLGGYVSDKLATKSGIRGRLLVLVACLIASTPFFVGILTLPMPWAFLCHIPATLIGEMWIGVCIAVVLDLVPVDLTATAVAVYFFIIQIVGGNMPLIVPPLSEVTNTRTSLLLCLPGGCALGAGFFILTLLYFTWKKRISNNHSFEEPREALASHETSIISASKSQNELCIG